jgi:hypothetical protein
MAYYRRMRIKNHTAILIKEVILNLDWIAVMWSGLVFELSSGKYKTVVLLNIGYFYSKVDRHSYYT